MGQKSKYSLWQLRLCGLLLLTCGSLTITLPDKAEAQSTSTSNSNCMDMGGGMVHCDTMGSNGSMSSSDCMNMGGSMATCNTMRMGQPQTGNPSVDMSRPQTSGVARSIIGDLIIRSQEKSFQKKLSKLLLEGDCDGAYREAFINQQFELASQIQRSCQLPAKVKAPETLTAEQFMAGTSALSLSSGGGAPSDPAEITVVDIKDLVKGDKAIAIGDFDFETPEGLAQTVTLKYRGQFFLLAKTMDSSVEKMRSRIDEFLDKNPWLEYSTSGTGSIYYYNIKSQRNLNDRIEVWVKIDHSKDRTVKARETKHLYEVYCKDQKIRPMQQIEYDAAGKVLASFDEPSDSKRVIPETVGSDLWDTMCSSTS